MCLGDAVTVGLKRAMRSKQVNVLAGSNDARVRGFSTLRSCFVANNNNTTT
jgi:hypothetical protein